MRGKGTNFRRFGVIVEELVGVLIRLTTRKRLTNSLPKLSPITLSPPETAG